MYFFVIPQLKKVAAMSPKCGCTSASAQILKDLDLHYTSEVHIQMKSVFPINNGGKPLTPEELNYEFEFYVRDPFMRLVSCFIHIFAGNKNFTKANFEKNSEKTFRDFIIKLFQHDDEYLKGHIIPQSKGFFEAPWKIFDISKDLNLKFNTSKYTRGHKKKAWNIPIKDLFENNPELPSDPLSKTNYQPDRPTYSPNSFYSKELDEVIRTYYKEDYDLLNRFNVKLFKPKIIFS